MSVTVVVSTGTGVTVVVSTFVTIVVSTVPAAVSVRATGSFEIGMRLDERVILAGHFAVGSRRRDSRRVLSRVLCAIAEDDITILVRATATPVAYSPLLRMFMIPPLLRQLLIGATAMPSSNAEVGRRRASMCHGPTLRVLASGPVAEYDRAERRSRLSGFWGQTPFRANGVRLQLGKMGPDARSEPQIREMESDPISRKWCLTPIPDPNDGPKYDQPRVLLPRLRQTRLPAMANPTSPAAARRNLTIRHTELTALPESVWQERDLLVFNVSNNKLTAIPDAIRNLKGVRMVDLAHNEIRALPDGIGELDGLSDYLYLSDNKLTDLPRSIGKLTRLRYLNVSDNQLARLPESIGDLASLIELRASGNHLLSLPESVGRLASLRELHVANNDIVEIPKSIGSLSELRKLNLESNKLTRLPETIGNLDHLFELNVRGNRINALPESVRRLHRLAYLDLRANGITSLPDGVADLPLEKLDLRWNPIERYPVWLDQLEARGCVVYR